jgi:dephospho-CoA kinase
MLRVGLTGGLASGKSTVAGFFRELGAFHVDADAIVHFLLQPSGRAFAPVVARFGRSIVDGTGAIDRKALAGIVFGDAAALEDLNGIVHPLVREEISRAVAVHAASGDPAPLALIDAALLVETGMHRDLDALILVACRPETQIARAVARGHSAEEAAARVAAQAPLDAKRAEADFVIDTDATLEQTQSQVRQVWDALIRGQLPN